MPCRALKPIITTLNWILKITGSQCNLYKRVQYGQAKRHPTQHMPLHSKLVVTSRKHTRVLHVDYIAGFNQKMSKAWMIDNKAFQCRNWHTIWMCKKDSCSHKCHLLFKKESWVQEDLQRCISSVQGSAILTRVKDDTLADSRAVAWGTKTESYSILLELCWI